MNHRIARFGTTLLFVALLAACGQSTATTTTSTTAGTTGSGAATSQASTQKTSAASSGATASTGGVSTSTGGAAAPAGSVKLTDGKIVLGVLNDQSAIYSDLSGVKSVEAVKMAIEDFKAKYGDNALGGAIEVVTADHQNKADLANSKAQEMYDRQNVDAILDVPNSAAGLAVAGVAKAKHKIFLAIGPATTDLTGAQCNKYTFHYAYDTYMLAHGTGTAVTQTIGKSWYIIYPNYAFGQDMDKNFTAAIEANGGKILLHDAVPTPNEDFSTFLLKAPSLNPKPEILGTMQAGGDLVNVVKQYNEFKLRDQNVKLAIGLLFLTDIHALGPDAFAGSLFTDAWYWNLDKDARDWADRFLARTKVRPTFAHAANYSAAMQYLEAVRRAGTDDPDAVVKALEGYKFNDFFARNALIRPEDHRVIHDVYLAQVKPASEVKEDWDYEKILKTIPADQAFRPVSDTTCKFQ